MRRIVLIGLLLLASVLTWSAGVENRLRLLVDDLSRKYSLAHGPLYSKRR